MSKGLMKVDGPIQQPCFPIRINKCINNSLKNLINLSCLILLLTVSNISRLSLSSSWSRKVSLSYFSPYQTALSAVQQPKYSLRIVGLRLQFSLADKNCIWGRGLAWDEESQRENHGLWPTPCIDLARPGLGWVWKEAEKRGVALGIAYAIFQTFLPKEILTFLAQFYIGEVRIKFWTLELRTFLEEIVVGPHFEEKRSFQGLKLRLTVRFKIRSG